MARVGRWGYDVMRWTTGLEATEERSLNNWAEMGMLGLGCFLMNTTLAAGLTFDKISRP